MQITFDDRHGQRLRGRVVGSGQIGAVPVLVVHTVDRGYIVDAQTRHEFRRPKKEASAC